MSLKLINDLTRNWIFRKLAIIQRIV